MIAIPEQVNRIFYKSLAKSAPVILVWDKFADDIVSFDYPPVESELKPFELIIERDGEEVFVCFIPKKGAESFPQGPFPFFLP